MGKLAVTMKVWLIVWGILAFIALTAPGVVAVAAFLVIPGLILVSAPTIFLYSAVFALLQRFLAMRPGLALNVTAAGLAFALGWLVAQPWAIAGRLAFAHANLPEVVPTSPVKLAGNIRLEIPAKMFSGRRDPESCNALCAALLDTPGVESVILERTGRPTGTTSTPLVYRLIPRAGDRSRRAYPIEPEAILRELPPEPERSGRRDLEAEFAARKKDEQAVAAAWGLRLASRQKLVAERVQTTPDMTVRIIQEYRPGLGRISISRVEILDRNGKALMRRSIVVGRALSAPLSFNGTGSIESFHVGLSQTRLTSGPENPPLRPIPELFQYSSLARPEVNHGLMPVLLNRLRSATSNPALTADDPDFVLADLWIPTIDWRHLLPADQLSVLSGVIADVRVPVPQKLYSGYESNVAPELRTALGSRILSASTPPQTRNQLALLLSRMPKGTFSKPSDDEKAILSSRDLRRDAYPLIVRLADQGEVGHTRFVGDLEERNR